MDAELWGAIAAELEEAASAERRRREEAYLQLAALRADHGESRERCAELAQSLAGEVAAVSLLRGELDAAGVVL